MNEDVNGNMKLFWKKVSNVEKGKVKFAAKYRMID